ncbi:hypothetical protein [Aquirhabdus parva]|uniref:Uncharacterized protein n=1 Tax=Aquirhabdus parva TaxID=2283318 RepID=A0A345P6A3_9GAMM|nr:hypothetical protein [Aquirhabdus parva]AXI02812.1 hypothetical protein HYN46_08170 [Aquirhabdus parva]
MGEWSEYFEDFPEENPANQQLKDARSPISNLATAIKQPKGQNQSELDALIKANKASFIKPKVKNKR